MTQVEPERTILVIDDERAIREVGKLLLEQKGYRVLTAGGGEEVRQP